MNIPYQKALLPALVSSIVLLSACGGGSDPAPTANKTLTTGVITGFGSVYVNGCKYETDNARIDADDVAADGATGQANLDIGMVVTVSGETSTDASGNCTGTADKIIYDNDVEGPVAAGSLVETIDPLTSARSEVSVTILGQVVIMNPDTRFKSESGAAYDLSAVAEGDILEVSGLMDDTGALVATHVELQDEKDYSTEKYELKGMIDALDTVAMTFSINGMPISYDDMTEFDDMTSDQLADGLYVEVKGKLNDAGDTLMADKIEAEDNGMEEGEEYHSELEGVISNYDPESMTFTLQGMTVDASSPGLEIKPSGMVLGDGLRVEVEGDLVVAEDGTVTLVADEIKKKGDKIEIQAEISAIDSDSDPSATLLTVSIFGQELTVRVNQWTEFENDVDNGQMYTVGDFVEVEAMDDGSGVINATELKVKPADDFELEGPVDSYDMVNMTVTVFGITFDISQATLEMDHDMPAPAVFWENVDGQGHVKLVDEYPADGIIDKIKVDDD
jgi:hypothetical protein